MHVQGADGEEELWLDPEIRLAVNAGLSAQQLASAQAMIQEHPEEIRNVWKEYFHS